MWLGIQQGRRTMRGHDERVQIACEVVEGLSVGDALGESLSYRPYVAREICDYSSFRPGTVAYTDDTDFADNPSAIAENAARSARVTHFHPEGVAGAIAVALAAGAAVSARGHSVADAARQIWESVMALTPECTVKVRLNTVRSLVEATNHVAAREVGNGAEVSAQDTVPFCIWNACRTLGDFREALLSTVEVGGDCDTNCAIVCGIVAGFVGMTGIPPEWLRVREALR